MKQFTMLILLFLGSNVSAAEITEIPYQYAVKNAGTMLSSTFAVCDDCPPAERVKRRPRFSLTLVTRHQGRRDSLEQKEQTESGTVDAKGRERADSVPERTSCGCPSDHEKGGDKNEGDK